MVLAGLFKFYIGDYDPLIPENLKAKARTVYYGGRTNVIRSVYSSWVSTRLFYENFNDNTGAP